MGVLRNIQLGLECYYDLVPFMDVEDCRLQRVGDVGHDRECLMVRTRGDYVELGLFVDPELEERAAEFHGLGGPGLDAGLPWSRALAISSMSDIAGPSTEGCRSMS